MKKTNILLAGLITMALLIFFFYFTDVFMRIAIWAGMSVGIVMMIFIIGFVLISIFSIPYYLIKKDKEVQDRGSYSIDDIEGEE